MNMLRKVKEAVSGDRYRYRNKDYDLDLCYVTTRLIAMGFPGDGLTGMYRNSSKATSRFLEDKHGDHYMLWNLSQWKYDYLKFQNQVLEFGFLNHHPPTLELLFNICRSIDSWLAADDKNVSVVHCVAGKGRTGTIVSAYMIYCGLFENPDDAIDYFSAKRSSSVRRKGGVTNPSQRRYVEYFDKMLNHNFIPNIKPMRLDRLMVGGLNGWPSSWVPRIRIFKMETVAACNDQEPDVKHSLYYISHMNSNTEANNSFNQGQGIYLYPVNMRIRGDYTVIADFRRTAAAPWERLFRIGFHSGFFEGRMIRLTADVIDDVHSCKRLAKCPDFFVDLYVRPFEDHAHQSLPALESPDETGPTQTPDAAAVVKEGFGAMSAFDGGSNGGAADFEGDESVDSESVVAAASDSEAVVKSSEVADGVDGDSNRVNDASDDPLADNSNVDNDSSDDRIPSPKPIQPFQRRANDPNREFVGDSAQTLSDAQAAAVSDEALLDSELEELDLSADPKPLLVNAKPTPAVNPTSNANANRSPGIGFGFAGKGKSGSGSAFHPANPSSSASSPVQNASNSNSSSPRNGFGFGGAPSPVGDSNTATDLLLDEEQQTVPRFLGDEDMDDIVVLNDQFVTIEDFSTMEEANFQLAIAKENREWEELLDRWLAFVSERQQRCIPRTRSTDDQGSSNPGSFGSGNGGNSSTSVTNSTAISRRKPEAPKQYSRADFVFDIASVRQQLTLLRKMLDTNFSKSVSLDTEDPGH